MRYTTIAIEREYASGGQEIGRLTAAALGIPCYGQEILELAAKKQGVTAKYLESQEERPTNSFLYGIYMLSKNLKGDTMALDGNEALASVEGQIILELASRGPCVFIGHCAGWFLRHREDVLNIFVGAGKSFRCKRAQEVYGIPVEEAESTLKKHDKQRAGYYAMNTGKTWNDPKNYHLVLDSSRLGIKRCAAIIAEAAR